MVTLLRHTAVARHWQGCCYGASDVGLSAAGLAAARALAEALPVAGVTRLQASPLRRARLLGGLLSRRLGLPLEIVPALRERDFGAWEGRSWDAIHAETGDSMMGMIEAPDSFRPGGGETTAELAQRVLAWFETLPTDGGVVAVTHGGPVAALRGRLAGLPVPEWLGLIPAHGEAVRLPGWTGC
ncbi:histidine phosphatase family protein [Falsiroseomonas sp.]|uniref:histidine phosphatase family protein n=1 Tax=Falsiroseomonas sp. TaxID=2870721 RepID=UPI002716F3DD|nr:histidine phosphatase family protein [Falsiroseomonas sp.]MDO9498701.1 histidine phosphatase family protein [Falsiroseomonas sp.]